MANVLFTNVRILDGTGDYPYTGEVLVQGNRIKQVTKGSSRFGAGLALTTGRRQFRAHENHCHPRVSTRPPTPRRQLQVVGWKLCVGLRLDGR